MTTDSQPAEQPESTAKFRFPEVVKLGPVRPLSPEEREEWNRDSPQARRPQKVEFFGFVHLGTLKILSPEEREEYDRNSPSFAQAARRRAEREAEPPEEPPTAD